MSFEGSSGRYKLRSGILTVALQKKQKKLDDLRKKKPPASAEEIEHQAHTNDIETHQLLEEFVQERHEDLEDDSTRQSGTFSKNQLAQLLHDCTIYENSTKTQSQLSVDSWKEKISQKIVLLHFFTYCCSNCLCVFPNLKPLEKLSQEKDRLLIISVHGPKFPEETQHLSKAIERYDIHHLVISDPQKIVYSEFGISSWPSFLLLTPRFDCSILYFGSGEDSLAVVEKILSQEKYFQINDEKSQHNDIKQFNDHQNNNQQSQHTNNNNNNNKSTISSKLSFPGGISGCDLPDGTKLVVCDSHHHRVLGMNLEGQEIWSVGQNQGYQDGSFEQVQFYSPQGVYVDSEEQMVYVADTFNHCIRQIDLGQKRVSTLVGTGKKARGISLGGNSGISTLLSLPWGLVLYRKDNEKYLFFSNASAHQIWVYNFNTQIASRFAGSGIEANRNSTSFKISAFAQPSGICIGKHNDQDYLFVADSESSSIRSVPLDWLNLSDPKNSISTSKTIVGGDEKNYFNLNAFGDVDGKSPDARLAHPLDVCWDSESGFLFVVDTYNHKLKKIDLDQESSSTMPLAIQLSEPAALTIVRNDQSRFLFICNTNFHKLEMLKL